MRIELKSFKHIASLSEETVCFTAFIYIDGKKAGRASNRGHGGQTDIEPRELQVRLAAYAATLPRVECKELKDPHDPTKPFTFAPTADYLIDKLVQKLEEEREAKRIEAMFLKAFTTRLITQDAKGAVYQTKAVGPAEVLRLSTHEGYLAKQKAAGHIILNLLPVDEARAIWMKAVVR